MRKMDCKTNIVDPALLLSYTIRTMRTPGPVWPWKHWPLYVLLLLSIYLARGILWLCIAPPMEMWDEYQHIAYFAFLDENGRPAQCK